jgi:hypothetical protein
MGFAAACILALLVWVFGALRKPGSAPAHAAPGTAPSAAPAAPKSAAPAAPKSPAAGGETKTGAAYLNAIRKEA